jgi:hypothetical protein
MSRRMPEDLTSFIVVIWRIEIEKGEGTGTFEWSFQVPKLAIHLCRSEKGDISAKDAADDAYFFTLHTFAMMILSAKLFEISFAISIGEVSHDVPFRSLPSGRVMIISCLGCSVAVRREGRQDRHLTSHIPVTTTHLISIHCNSTWLRRRWHYGSRRTREVEKAVRRRI